VVRGSDGVELAAPLRMRIAVAAVCLLFSPQPRTERVLVESVVDGNTIQVAGYGRVQLAGVKVPSARGRRAVPDPIARDARQRLDVLLTRNFVRLEFQRRSSTAYVLLDDGTLVNALLAREGLARVVSRQSDPHHPELERAQDQAKQLHRGVWALREP
jgi:endonuclease YncB( thermonuclease family)